MTKYDLVNNMETISKSDVKAFMEILQADGDIPVIGQFGLSFYYAYLVADKVSVVSKHNNDKQYLWESDAEGIFTICSDPGEPLGRGTKIILHLKENYTEILQQEKITIIIQEHCQSISYPIKLVVESIYIKALRDNEAKDGDEKHDDEDATYEDTDNNKNKMIKEKYWVEHILNNTQPIWTQNLNDSNEAELIELYKSLTNDWESHLAIRLISYDDKFKFKALLFIPRHAPFHTFENKKAKDNIKLYVRHMFIMDNGEDLMPEYLSFIKGVVDGESLPLNISREMLEQNQILKIMKKNLVNSSLEMLAELAENEEKYKIFYEEFSKNIKIAVYEDKTNRKQFANLLRFYTSASGDKACSLKDYVARMKQNQIHIYYITGESRRHVANSIFVERIKMCGYEVIYMTDPMDEYLLDELVKFDGKNLISATKEELEFPETDEEKKKREQDQRKFENLCKVIKEILGKNVEKVVISNRLIQSPCCIVTSKHGWTANMERILKAQKLYDSSTENYMRAKKQLEINPDHPIINTLKEKAENNPRDKAVSDLVILLFETSMLSSGFELKYPQFLVSKIYKMIECGLSLEEDLPVSEERLAGIESTPAVEAVTEYASPMEELD